MSSITSGGDGGGWTYRLLRKKVNSKRKIRNDTNHVPKTLFLFGPGQVPKKTRYVKGGENYDDETLLGELQEFRQTYEQGQSNQATSTSDELDVDVDDEHESTNSDIASVREVLDRGVKREMVQLFSFSEADVGAHFATRRSDHSHNHVRAGDDMAVRARLSSQSTSTTVLHCLYPFVCDCRRHRRDNQKIGNKFSSPTKIGWMLCQGRSMKECVEGMNSRNFNSLS